MAWLETLDPNRAFIIAEVGTNHQADDVPARIMRAESLISVAAGTGADAVKFQIFGETEPLFCPVEGDEARWEYWKRTCIPLDDWEALIKHAENEGIKFLASVFQESLVKWVDSVGLFAHKVASRAAKTYPYHLADAPFIISNGMGLPDNFPRYSIILHCISRYPVGLHELELDEIAPGMGYSSHCPSPWAAIGAIAAGARIVEVHMRDNTLKGKSRDYAVELEPRDVHLICEARDGFATMRSGR